METRRRLSNRDRAETLLRERGATGATNGELAAVAGHKFNERLRELKLLGRMEWTIANEGSGCFRYRLAVDPVPG